MINSKNHLVNMKHTSFAVWIVSIWGVAILFGVALRLGWVPAIDLPILTWIHNNQIDGLQQFMYIITLGGYLRAYIIVLSILALILIPRKQIHAWVVLTLNAAATFGINELMKVIFQRERPLVFFQIEQEGFSYPSGHAMVSVAFYLLAAMMLAKAFPKLKWVAVILGVVSFLPGLSRLFMGVHYPTDIIMGWLLGLSAAFFWYRIWGRKGTEHISSNKLAGCSTSAPLFSFIDLCY
ncbi:MAG TPA: phosphatase PAP2 family protein [Clostridiaceae bacterium]|nr:phosphatase PAP2 family protein [Clostridiaceae bacterium]